MEGAAVSQVIGNDSIIGALDKARDINTVLIEGQASSHLIVHDVVLSTLLHIDGNLEVHGLTDISIVLAAIVTGGIFLNRLINGGVGVLLVDFHSSLVRSRVSHSQSTIGGGNQIVARLQSFKGKIAVCSRSLSANSSNTVFRGKLCGRFCKSGDITVCLPGHIAVGNRNIGRTSAFTSEEVLPIRVNSVSISGLVVVHRQVQHLVNLVSLVRLCVFNSDRVAPRRQCADAEGQGHDQCQQKAGKFLHLLHFCNTSFFLCHFLRGRNGIYSQPNVCAPFLRFPESHRTAADRIRSPPTR